MIIKFTSENSGEFVMLSHVAEPLLKMMGASGNLKGAVSGDELRASLDRLETALRHHTEPGKTQEEEDEDKELPVALGTRAVPLVQMLKTACESDSYVMWQPE